MSEDQSDTDEWSPDPAEWDDPAAMAEQMQQEMQQQQSRSTGREIVMFVLSIAFMAVFVGGTAGAYYFVGIEVAVVVGLTLLVTLNLIDMM